MAWSASTGMYDAPPPGVIACAGDGAYSPSQLPAPMCVRGDRLEAT
jgi:hypothetical protein